MNGIKIEDIEVKVGMKFSGGTYGDIIYSSLIEFQNDFNEMAKDNEEREINYIRFYDRKTGKRIDSM